MLQKNCVVRWFYILLFMLVFCGKVFTQQTNARDYLITALNASGWQPNTEALSAWKAKQKESCLQKIKALPDSVKQYLIKHADEALSFNWPALPASSFLEYRDNGNRIRYEKKQTERRNYLNALAIAEIISGDKKYMPQLLNGLWATLEESTWEIPAIVELQKAGADLPDPSEQVIGLVSAESAAMIANIQLMLAEQLDAYSPIINKRITFELHRRMLDPYMQRNDFWWMGFSGRPVNNWNAWINANVLQVALLTETNGNELSQLIHKIFKSADYFINQYPADGGCDEGPTYWSLAGGKLIKLLYLANSASDGKLSWAANTLLHNIGTYIYKTHIAGDYFVNFADASSKTIPNAESVYRFGEMFNDDSLKHFAAYLFSLKNKMPENNLVDFLAAADIFNELTTLKPDPMLISSAALEDIQVFTARSVAGSTSGLFMAVQGGHNAESHNHNDVGNFIVYANGEPVIVDAGVGTYTAQTFSNKRYEIWTMQSQWHNCPLINGVMQKDGRQYKASDVSFETTKNGVHVGMNIEQAYPSEAFVKKWNRQFLFDQKNNKLTLSENFQLEKITGKTSINFLSSCFIKTDVKGEIGFYNSKGNLMLTLKYIPGLMTASIEEKILDDEKLTNAWGNKLYRLSFTLNDRALKKGGCVFELLAP
ncbi:heparinase II/III domain-containing protein [Parafilimonas terrae]|uniref:Heparinase II/III-like protein n=1 Tax=Parafilimonas terrae TaxID=1465490 RepID=A0A1I5XSL4_9BACT|nr:heparinase II/III family protein [Parafilimonas terrae]SFQ34910.1 Heparinase II/III-like protein [Parafilimonas terrae]